MLTVKFLFLISDDRWTPKRRTMEKITNTLIKLDL